MNKRYLIVSIIFFSGFWSSCSNDDEVMESSCIEGEWEYEGESNTANWGTCYAQCSGQLQSPVDITGVVVSPGLVALETQYESVPIDLVNNGHTIEFEYEAGSKLTLNGRDYDLVQFHFHTDSEHTRDGQRYPMETHLVHKDEITGNLVVVGILFKEGKENTFLANFIDNLPEDDDAHYTSQSKVNIKDLLPQSTAYYTYTGSLTTPPCSEIVTWFVMKSPVETSSDQISKFHEIIKNNYRPLQPLNDRKIYEFN